MRYSFGKGRNGPDLAIGFRTGPASSLRTQVRPVTLQEACGASLVRHRNCPMSDVRGLQNLQSTFLNLNQDFVRIRKLP